jgi:LmbE family N-acetylglucosaminyl deacetylase
MKATVTSAALLVLLTGCARDEFPTIPPAQHGDSVLVIAPHIDDEAIGAAGYIADALRAGARVAVVYLTAGDDNFLSTAIEDRTVSPRARDHLREGSERIEEGRRAMHLLGVRDLFFLGYPDRGLQRMLRNPGEVVEAPGTRLRQVPYPEALSPGADYTLTNLVRDLRAVIARTRPTIIIATAKFDNHPDHAATGVISQAIAKELHPSPRLLWYLVHAADYPDPYLSARQYPLLPPRHFRRHQWATYPLSAQNEEMKARVLANYTTQWNDPWARHLMRAFIRRNELFVKVE